MKNTLKQLIKLTDASIVELRETLNNSKKLKELNRTKKEVLYLIHRYQGKYDAYLEILNYMHQCDKYNIKPCFAEIIGHWKEKEIKNAV